MLGKLKKRIYKKQLSEGLLGINKPKIWLRKQPKIEKRLILKNVRIPSLGRLKECLIMKTNEGYFVRIIGGLSSDDARYLSSKYLRMGKVVRVILEGKVEKGKKKEEVFGLWLGIKQIRGIKGLSLSYQG